jgi:excisionase family DNA binding protein
MTAQNIEPRWVSPKDAADYAQVCTKTIRRMVAQGTIPARRLGSRAIRIDLNDLDAAMRVIPAARAAGR